MPSSHAALIVDADPKGLESLVYGFQGDDWRITACPTPETASLLVKASGAEIVVIASRTEHEKTYSLVKQLRSKEAFHTLPVLVLGPENIRKPLKEHGEVDLLPLPAFVRDVLSASQLLVATGIIAAQQPIEEPTFATHLTSVAALSLVRTMNGLARSGLMHLERKGRHGEILFHEGELTAAQVGQLQGMAAIQHLLIWNDGSVQLNLRPVVRRGQLHQTTQEFLEEFDRFLRDFKHTIKEIGPDTAVFTRNEQRLQRSTGVVPAEVTPVVRLCDGQRTLSDVIDESPFRVLDTIRILARLVELAILTPMDSKSETEIQAPRTALDEFWETALIVGPPAPRAIPSRLGGTPEPMQATVGAVSQAKQPGRAGNGIVQPLEIGPSTLKHILEPNLPGESAFATPAPVVFQQPASTAPSKPNLASPAPGPAVVQQPASAAPSKPNLASPAPGPAVVQQPASAAPSKPNLASPSPAPAVVQQPASAAPSKPNLASPLTTISGTMVTQSPLTSPAPTVTGTMVTQSPFASPLTTISGTMVTQSPLTSPAPTITGTMVTQSPLTSPAPTVTGTIAPKSPLAQVPASPRATPPGAQTSGTIEFRQSERRSQPTLRGMAEHASVVVDLGEVVVTKVKVAEPVVAPVEPPKAKDLNPFVVPVEPSKPEENPSSRITGVLQIASSKKTTRKAPTPARISIQLDTSLIEEAEKAIVKPAPAEEKKLETAAASMRITGEIQVASSGRATRSVGKVNQAPSSFHIDPSLSLSSASLSTEKPSPSKQQPSVHQEKRPSQSGLRAVSTPPPRRPSGGFSAIESDFFAREADLYKEEMAESFADLDETRGKPVSKLGAGVKDDKRGRK